MRFSLSIDVPAITQGHLCLSVCLSLPSVSAGGASLPSPPALMASRLGLVAAIAPAAAALAGGGALGAAIAANTTNWNEWKSIAREDEEENGQQRESESRSLGLSGGAAWLMRSIRTVETVGERRKANAK